MSETDRSADTGQVKKMTEGIKKNEPNAREVYADIIDLPHWQSPSRGHMSLLDRAAQFSPFAALSAYEEMVDEETREVGAEVTLSETEMELLSAKNNVLSELIENGEAPEVTITYFVPDSSKIGGSYVDVTDRIRRIDLVNRKIELYRRIGVSGSYMRIDMDRIIDISGDAVDGIAD